MAKKPKIVLEACTEGYLESKVADAKGADRIELCENLAAGGTTPSYGTIKQCVQNLKAVTSVMIRPRGGNFTYSEEEIQIMKSDIQICQSLGVKSVVFGILAQESGKTVIDKQVTKELAELAKPMQVTFHMAFDEVDDLYRAVDELAELKFDRILTKGGKYQNALEGKESLKKLILYAGNRITIMPGKSINQQNMAHIAEYTGARELHGTRIV